MNYHDSHVIIGISRGADLKQTEKKLSNIPGFLKLLYTYSFSNAILIEVSPDHLENFMKHASGLDHVEYVERNFILTTSSYLDIVMEKKLTSKYSNRTIRKLHGLKINHKAGKCVKIACIDTGITPHPYLPATSFYEMTKRSESFTHYLTSIESQKILQEIIDLEKNTNTYMHNLPDNEYNTFKNQLAQKTDNLYRHIYENWGTEADQWRNDFTKKYSRNTNKNVITLPIYPNFWGIYRRISPFSYNFCTNSLSVNDENGHGTQIAGILSGRAPSSFRTDQNNILTHDIDTMGIVPCSELLILKCHEETDKKNNHIGNLIRALEYAAKNGADIIYLGLTFNPATTSTFNTYKALDRTLQECKRRFIPIICPAGNVTDQTSQEGLNCPAMCDDVWAISSITLIDKNHTDYLFSKHSRYADVKNNESIDFSAFGGDTDNGIWTTSLDFGFKNIVGTSIAAGIATGILSLAISKECLEEINSCYDEFMKIYLSQFFKRDTKGKLSDNGTRESKPSELIPFRFNKTTPFRRGNKFTTNSDEELIIHINNNDPSSLKMDAIQYADTSLKSTSQGLPDPKFGYGVIRKFPKKQIFY